MLNEGPTTVSEFERESHRIDQMIWDAMALRSGESALFCGFVNDGPWIDRAVAVGVRVSVVESNEDAIRENSAGRNVEILRGSTTMIPARDASFDAAVAFHYLHEIDPFFHAQVVSELARVGRRLIVVEPAPPSDPLGLRIASLYSRAKRELGQFEYYQQADYWRKLIAIVKTDVSVVTLSFTRTPPRFAIRDTVALLLDTMAAEDVPEPYLAELRALAKRPDAQLVPQARSVLVGAAAGYLPAAGAGTSFRDAPAIEAPASTPAVTAASETGRVYSAPERPELPPVVPPHPPAAAGSAASPVPIPAPAAPISPPAGLPFGLDPTDESLRGSGFGWEWEPPEVLPPDDATS